MTTPTADPQSDGFRLPRAFPTLRREAGGLIWTATDNASTEDLRLHLGYRLWKLWREIDDIREIVVFMHVARKERPDIPIWVSNQGALPQWVDLISEDDYEALDHEQCGDIDEEAGD